MSAFKAIISDRDTDLAKNFEFDAYLNTGLDGIAADTIEGRKETYGINSVPKTPPKSIWRIMLNTMSDPLLGLLAISATIATIFGIVFEEQKKNSEWIEGIAIWFTIIVIVAIGSYNDFKQDRAFHKLNSENDTYMVKVIRDGNEMQISNKELVVGDLVILSAGDNVPADGYLVTTNKLGLDESALTGEGITIMKNFETDPWLRSGSVVTEGIGSMYVIAVGQNSEFGRTLALVQKESGKTPLQKRILRFVKWCGIVALCVSMSVFIAQTVRWTTMDPRPPVSSGPLKYIVFSITIIVVGLPEGLPAAVMITLTYSVKKMLQDNLFVRHLSACETLGSTSMLLSDKTGTLTENKMSVVKCVLNNTMFDHTPPIGNMKALFEDILMNCSINSSAFLTEAHGVGSQTEVALLRFVDSYSNHLTIRENNTPTEITPFSSKTKMSSVVVNGKTYLKGAPEIVMETCAHVATVEGDIVMSDEIRKSHMGHVRMMASSGLRTIALLRDDVLLAIFGIKDPVRRSVPAAVKMCESAGIGIIMVTGDNIDTAKHIANDIGMMKHGDIAVEGKDFRKMSREERVAIAPKLRVLARSSPEDKFELVKLYKELGHVVAASGDGANDAPALKEADVGCAMGSGTDLAKEASDIVILNDDFDSIVSGVRWGRNIMANIRAFITFQVAINIVALVVVSTAAFSRGTTPLNVAQLVYVNLVMDSFAAIGLSTSPPSTNLMNKKPGHRDEFVITVEMLRSILPQALYQVVVQLVLFFVTPELIDISEKQLSGLMFNTFIFCQIFNFINVVSKDNIFPIFAIFKKYIALACVFGLVALQVIIMFLIGNFFKIEKITPNMWGVSVAVGSGSAFMHAIVVLTYNWLQNDNI
ncbi:calcium-transporting ATPase, plasma membrane-type [Paramecium bursaria Chlorella virus Fr5L]|jgi:Ca2+-transporting ATPase|nr:calcium-transporting ATPase, plasma membrane-type [Paramecium bursaria Chlorella virus Fr5L]